MTRNDAQAGSVLLIVNPFGGDAAFLCDKFRELGARSSYQECSPVTALAFLRDRQLPVIQYKHRIESHACWEEIFEFLDRSMALPRLIIAAESACSDLWSEAVASTVGEVLVVPC